MWGRYKDYDFDNHIPPIYEKSSAFQEKKKQEENSLSKFPGW